MNNRRTANLDNGFPRWGVCSIAVAMFVGPYVGAYMVNFDLADMHCVARLQLPSIVPLGLLFLAAVVKSRPKLTFVLSLSGWVTLAMYLVWHQDDRARPLVRQYLIALDSVLESHPELQGCVVSCAHCGVRFLVLHEPRRGTLALRGGRRELSPAAGLPGRLPDGQAGSSPTSGERPTRS
jgi:hypothetical protein